MTTLDEDGSMKSELRESIHDADEEGQQSNYSLEFDEDNDALESGDNEGFHGHRQRSPLAVGAGKKERQQWCNQDATQYGGERDPRRGANDSNKGNPDDPPSSSPGPRGSPRGESTNKKDSHEHPRSPARDDLCSTVPEAPSRLGVEDSTQERGARGGRLPIQVFALKARLDGLLQGACKSPDGEHMSATEALTKVTREHAALRQCLGDVERELVTARRKVAQDASAQLRGIQEKRARAEIRRVRHFEKLGEERRAAVAAKAEAKALRARLQDEATELQHTRDMLKAARSTAAAAEKRADQSHEEAIAAKASSDELLIKLADARAEAEEERRRASVVARDAENAIELCEKKRELEVDAATREAASRERAVEEQLKRLPEHQQQLLQAEKDRVVRWEERLAAESASLDRRVEAHKIDMEACRIDARRFEAEARARIEEDASRERSSLKEAKSALEKERGELLRRVARAEAAGQASTAEAAAQVAEANETRQRFEAEKSALDIRASMLAPQLMALEEGRAALEGLRREAGDGARRAKEKVCRALEMEAGVVEREGAVEVKWAEITTARRALKQMEKKVFVEAEELAEQRKSISLARVRLHEQQMEMALQMSEIRKALELMKRVDSIGDGPARRLAVELGTLACDRGERAARRTRDNAGDDFAAALRGSGAVAVGQGSVNNGGGEFGGDRGDGGGGSIGENDVAMRVTSRQERNGEGMGAGRRDHPFAATCEGTARTMVAAASRAMGDAQDEAGVMGAGACAYADEAGARKALEKVRSLITSDGGGWGRASGLCSGDGGGGGGGADEGGGSRAGLSVQGWARRLQAAAIANGACPDDIQ